MGRPSESAKYQFLMELVAAAEAPHRFIITDDGRKVLACEPELALQAAIELAQEWLPGQAARIEALVRSKLSNVPDRNEYGSGKPAPPAYVAAADVAHAILEDEVYAETVYRTFRRYKIDPEKWLVVVSVMLDDERFPYLRIDPPVVS